MNKLAAMLAPLFSTLTIVVVGFAGTGCVVAGESEGQGWEDVLDEEVGGENVGTDEEAILDSCVCTCGNGISYIVANPSPSNQGCMGVCQNFFLNNPSLSCGGVPGSGYPITTKR